MKPPPYTPDISSRRTGTPEPGQQQSEGKRQGRRGGEAAIPPPAAWYNTLHAVTQAAEVGEYFPPILLEEELPHGCSQPLTAQGLL